jgi:hypothetical protein
VRIAADCLQDPHRDQPERARRAVQPGHPQQDGEHREYRETQGVDPHPAEHVAQSAEGHHQHRSDQKVAQDQPQQQAGVAWQQRVHPDPAEDVRQRDQDDRPVDRRHQRAQRGVGQGDPPVARAGHGGARAVGQALACDEPHNFLPAPPVHHREWSWLSRLPSTTAAAGSRPVPDTLPRQAAVSPHRWRGTARTCRVRSSPHREHGGAGAVPRRGGALSAALELAGAGRRL